ncbi:MAG: DUF58 domain-containing protein, partial [bacterium]
LKLQDAETGAEMWVDTYDRNIREQYRELVLKQQKQLQNLLKASDVDQVELLVDRDYVKPLTRFFRMRAKRR